MAVLAQIADATGAQLSGVVADPPTVTIALHDVPVRQAIDRIVGDTNFTLRYGGDGTLRRISLAGRVGSIEAGRASAEVRFRRAWRLRPPIRLQGALASALGTTHLPPSRVLRAVRTLDDRAIRKKAVRAVVASIEADPTIADAWKSMTGAELAAFAQRNTGPHAFETLANIAAATNDPKVRAQVKAAIPPLAESMKRR